MFKGLKALIAGIIAGTALGVLFAPGRGEETRKNFKKEIEEGGTGMKTIKKTATKMGEDMESAGKNIYSELSKNEDFKSAEKNIKSHAKTVIKKAKTAIDKNIPKRTQKKAKEAYSKAKQIIKKVADKAVEMKDKIDNK
ncbi:MAG: YtxH domain-containing protein [Candidatus Gracilibacteria bacterium]|jgi:gas vesicle protein